MSSTTSSENRILGVYEDSPSSLGAGEAGAMAGSDLEALARHHRFVRDESEDSSLLVSSWEARLARKYYDRLFKEFALADLTRYRSGQIGLRWRLESEVISGKGSAICGALGCHEANELGTFELLFKYSEQGAERMELVKVRLCPRCSEKAAASSSVSIGSKRRRGID
jgi:hypothetical protein